ncbi:hypothetical protein CONPUDRAFT_163750 [Coniophora puteana RWD-64-598 SS2]|uniref:Uncharacterized protein n=1 Tax=Coniophora puteana (strain RWD-64-598) TaxID=741705 RepID=A0A5M3MU04_CONPW|nr:uncharacterized protein CONPUDRAFT_163750 [Coniophora puteana RWD-64-598 SS2]EIW82643.1 hypothetical protein CONPUDRAFT_163750 [Coniophora puteana RWD-64-598 SS2]
MTDSSPHSHQFTEEYPSGSFTVKMDIFDATYNDGPCKPLIFDPEFDASHFKSISHGQSATLDHKDAGNVEFSIRVPARTPKRRQALITEPVATLNPEYLNPYDSRISTPELCHSPNSEYSPLDTTSDLLAGLVASPIQDLVRITEDPGEMWLNTHEGEASLLEHPPPPKPGFVKELPRMSLDPPSFDGCMSDPDNLYLGPPPPAPISATFHGTNSAFVAVPLPQRVVRPLPRQGRNQPSRTQTIEMTGPDNDEPSKRNCDTNVVMDEPESIPDADKDEYKPVSGGSGKRKAMLDVPSERQKRTRTESQSPATCFHCQTTFARSQDRKRHEQRCIVPALYILVD